MQATVLETINRSVRDQFEADWLRGAPQDIEAALPDPGAEGYAATLEELVRVELEQSWRRHTAGGPAPRQVAEYARRFPTLNEQQRLERLLRAEAAARTLSGYGAPSPAVADAATVRIGAGETVAVGPNRAAQPALGEFGAYELLDKLGEGGMGIVYRARQKDANRVVALKVVHAAHAGSGREASRAKALERFRIEARAAAQLDHENIVPVYDVGQVGDHLYFSMRLVEGQSLNHVVRDQPLEQKRAARYVAGAARGVAEAHRLGVLHRDLKPHNVMLDARNDRPLVADFGLAKVVEADDQVTRTGEVIGTPSYMPPEQVSNAAAVDARADVYALGATLYHLVLGRPPFQAANTLATIRQVVYQDPVPARKLNAAIDRDLETILGKCLDKEPERRYPSASALADDLDRYLQGAPILARPLGPAERALRWCKRNRLAASLSALAALLALGVFAAVTIGYAATQAALGASERNFGIARDSIDQLYTEVSLVDLEDAPGMQPLKEKLLTKSLGYYQRLVEAKRDATLDADLADAVFRVGAIQAELGDRDAGARSLRRATELQAALLAAAPDDPGRRVALGDAWNELGRVEQLRGNLDEAGTAFTRALEVREGLVKDEPKSVEHRRKLANLTMNLGLLASRRGDTDGAKRLMAEAQEARDAIAREGENDAVAEDLAKGAYNLGALAARGNHFAEAATQLRLAVAGFEALLADRPESIKLRSRLATAQSLLADVLQLDGKLADSLKLFEAAEVNLTVLVDENPRVHEFQEQLTTLQLGRAQLALRLGTEGAKRAVAGEAPRENEDASRRHFDEARGVLRTTRERLHALLERTPDAVDVRYNLTVTLRLLADVVSAYGDVQGARDLLEQALATAAPLPEGYPDRESLVEGLRSDLESLGK